MFIEHFDNHNIDNGDDNDEGIFACVPLEAEEDVDQDIQEQGDHKWSNFGVDLILDHLSAYLSITSSSIYHAVIGGFHQTWHDNWYRQRDKSAKFVCCLRAESIQMFAGSI